MEIMIAIKEGKNRCEFSKGCHLAECLHVPLGQVALEKNTNLVHLVKALDQVPGSHLFKCRHPLG